MHIKKIYKRGIISTFNIFRERKKNIKTLYIKVIIFLTMGKKINSSLRFFIFRSLKNNLRFNHFTLIYIKNFKVINRIYRRRVF